MADDGDDETPPERLRKGLTLAERQAERHNQLIEAALDLFASKGYTATTIEEICRAAYVSTRNFYEEFENREALLLELYDHIVNKMITAVAEARVAPEHANDMYRMTRARLAAFVHCCTDDPRIARVALIEAVGVTAFVEERRRAMHKLFADYIADQARGYASGGELPERDYELISIGMVGAINEVLVDWALRDDRAPIDAVVNEVHGMFIAFTTALPAS